MKILITGSTGMVGRNLLEHAWIRAQDLLAPPRAELDLLNPSTTQDYVQRNRPDLIIHCAGKVGGIQANINDPLSFFELNLAMGMNLLVAARQAGVQRLLNLGSTCMYPANLPGPLHEAQLMAGKLESTNEAYALAKLAVAKHCGYINAFDKTYRYKTAIPCNLFGRHDHYSLDNSHLLAAAIVKIHTASQMQEENVEIWGDGEARREFLSATDLAAFIAFAIQHFDRMPDLINVGPGEDYSINDYYAAVARVLGYRGGFRHNLDKPTGMRRKLSDVTRLRDFGWSANLTLEQGVAEACAYYLDEINGDESTSLHSP